MKFILEFVTRTNEEEVAVGEGKLRSVQKGNSSRPTGSLRDERIGRGLQNVHGCLGLSGGRHAYLVAH